MLSIQYQLNPYKYFHKKIKKAIFAIQTNTTVKIRTYISLIFGALLILGFNSCATKKRPIVFEWRCAFYLVTLQMV